MSDSLGPIPIPDPPTIIPFPLRPDWSSGMDLDPPIAIHIFDQPGLKTEQRFVMGDGARRFRIHKDRLACAEYDNLKAHWELAEGIYAQFPYTYWGNFHGSSPEVITCRYENPNLTFPHLIGMLTGDPGVTLLEIPPPHAPYTSAGTVTRFPDSTFTTALEQQTQHLIPLVTIKMRDRINSDGSVTTYDPIHLSNQRITVDGVSYIARLVDWNGITQSLGEASDSATFTFGNADGVWIQLVNQVNFERAKVSFALFHAESRYICKLWTGYALPWSIDTEGHFQFQATDGLYELSLGYPVRSVTRTCWKVYKGRYCPSTSPLPDCPKSYEACQARGVQTSFGGMIVAPTPVHIKDNNTGVFGFGRAGFTSVSVVDDTVYQRPVQEVYTDISMEVSCDVAAARDESEFMSALGIVGEGPIGKYNPDLIRQRLDGQPPHDPLNYGGWRGIVGNDPANLVSDFFAIDQQPWNVPPTGSTYSGGLAFAEIRRTDPMGLQLAPVSERVMVVTIDQGIGGWTWTAPGSRHWTPALANFIWVAVNVWLRGLGLRADQARESAVSAAEMEATFDVTQAIAMAGIADLIVDKLIGDGSERQFPFRGILKERKPLKDWLQEIVNCGLGYFTFVDGKLWLGIRENAGEPTIANAYTRDSILYKSLQVAPHQPQFNWLVGQFGDEEFNFQLNNVTIYDIDHASYIGNPLSPAYLTNTMNFVGISNKSQCARVITTRLREELGGASLPEYLKARDFKFRTTVLGLTTMVGDIVSLTHSWVPDGFIKGRVQKWTLNPDFSIDIECNVATDSMYFLDFGPKPEDVAAPPIIPEQLPSITGLTWMPNEVGPAVGDPLYPDPLQRTFDVWQDYQIARDGTWEATIFVAGEMCINTFAVGQQPRILSAVLAAGGTLDGPQTVYLAVTQRILSGQPLAPSNLVGTFIPAGVTGRKITMTISNSPDADVAWDQWAGNDRRMIALQSSGTDIPTTLDFLGPIHTPTEGLPESAARKVAIAAKHAWHSGVAGVSVTGVPANDQIQANDFIGSPDDWVGRKISAIADQSDGSAPLWNFVVTAFHGSTGTFTVTPDAVRLISGVPDLPNSVQVGDVLIIRSKATSATANSYTDNLWDNSVAIEQFGSPGLRPDEEIGRICRILFGKGAGQYRYITGNTSDTITVSPAWVTVPDATSTIIVEAADWIYQAETSDLQVLHEGKRIEIKMRVENLRNEVALVAGFLVDDQGHYSAEAVAPMREIFVFGQPPTTRMVGPARWDPDRLAIDGTPDPGPWYAYATDHNLRCDTTGTTDVEVQLPPLAVYQGRPLLIFNDGVDGSHNVVVFTVSGETLFDGNTAVTVPPANSLRVTAG